MPSDLSSERSGRDWKNFCESNQEQTRDEQTAPRFASTTTRVHLVSCFGDDTGVDKASVLSTSDHPAVQRAEPFKLGECESVRVRARRDPCTVKGACLLLRDEHKARPNFHPRGDNEACHRDPHPAQHLCPRQVISSSCGGQGYIRETFRTDNIPLSGGFIRD